jgi:4-hydroxy-3-methylbut-2-enyl diphosphate reductase
MEGRRVIVAQPHGFCSGVARALALAEEALGRRGDPLFCLHEIVHNEQVIRRLANRGMRFVDRIEEIPNGATVLFPAHGIAPAVRAATQARGLSAVDATCPYVARLHDEVKRFASRGLTVVCIGHRGHDEVIGVVGEAPDRTIVVENEREARAVAVPDPARVAAVTQTTFRPETAAGILAVLKARFPLLRQPAATNVCHATRNRQEAVRRLAGQAERVLVLGSANSSNSLRLVETARAAGAQACLVSERSGVPAADLADVQVVGLTSGASTPESFLEEVLADLRAMGFTTVETLSATARPRAPRAAVVTRISAPERASSPRRKNVEREAPE